MTDYADNAFIYSYPIEMQDIVNGYMLRFTSMLQQDRSMQAQAFKSLTNPVYLAFEVCT